MPFFFLYDHTSQHEISIFIEHANSDGSDCSLNRTFAASTYISRDVDEGSIQNLLFVEAKFGLPLSYLDVIIFGICGCLAGKKYVSGLWPWRFDAFQPHHHCPRTLD